MSKSVMGAPRGRSNVLEDLQQSESVIADAPQRPDPQVTNQQERALTNEIAHVEAPRVGGLDLNAIRAMKPRKEPTLQTNARFPISLIDDIDLIRRLTGTSATDIMVEGTRREVARLKKQFGLE